MTKHTKSYLIAWTRNVSYLNLKYQKRVTISCDWSIVTLVTDRAWCERRIIMHLLENLPDNIGLITCRPKCRAPLGHSLLYCQGALMPCLTKHAINSRFIFPISRRYHLKWLSSYVYHISGYVLTLKETTSCPLFPDSYAFS